MTENYQFVADRLLSGITVTPVMKARILMNLGGTNTRARIKISLVVAIVVMMAALGAFALARGFGLLDWMATNRDPGYEQALLEAQQLIRQDLAFHSFPHVDVSINEAVYDGRMLRVMYTTKDRGAKAPFPKDEEGYLIEGEEGFRFPAAMQDGVFYSVDWCQVNGETAMAQGEARYFAGEGPGEIVALTTFDLRDIKTGDSLRVLLPVRGEDTPEALAFALDARDLPGVSRLLSPAPARFVDHEVRFSSFVLSPLRVYVSLDIKVDAGISPERCDQIASRWMDAQLDSLTMDVTSATLADRAGWTPEKPTQVGAELSFMPQAEYPQVFTLTSAEGEIRVPRQPVP